MPCVAGRFQCHGNLSREFLDDDEVELIGLEAGGKGIDTDEHASRMCGDRAAPGVAQGYKTMFLQDSDGQMLDTHSIAAGLDYVGISPILSDLGDQGRVRFEAATDSEVIDGPDPDHAEGGHYPGPGISARLCPGYP